MVECLDRDMRSADGCVAKVRGKRSYLWGSREPGLHKEANFCYFTAFAWSERMESCSNRHFVYLFHWMWDVLFTLLFLPQQRFFSTHHTDRITTRHKMPPKRQGKRALPSDSDDDIDLGSEEPKQPTEPAPKRVLRSKRPDDSDALEVVSEQPKQSTRPAPKGVQQLQKKTLREQKPTTGRRAPAQAPPPGSDSAVYCRISGRSIVYRASHSWSQLDLRYRTIFDPPWERDLRLVLASRWHWLQ